MCVLVQIVGQSKSVITVIKESGQSRNVCARQCVRVLCKSVSKPDNERVYVFISD